MVPRNSNVYVLFRCLQDLSWSYPLKSFLLGMKALLVAKETFIRINADGIMCIQHQVGHSKRIVGCVVEVLGGCLE